jgi:hypothetical protein
MGSRKILGIAAHVVASGIMFFPFHAQSDTGQSQRPIALQWEGYDEPVTGTAKRTEGNSGSLAISLPRNEGSCQGNYLNSAEAKNGAWSAVCTNGVAASGTYEVATPGGGSSGVGTDTKGRKVKFTIGGDGASAPQAQPSPSVTTALAPPPTSAKVYEGKWDWSIETANSSCSGFDVDDPIRIVGEKLEGSLRHPQGGVYRMDVKIAPDGKASGHLLGSHVIIRFTGAFTQVSGEGVVDVSGATNCSVRWQAKRVS